MEEIERLRTEYEALVDDYISIFCRKYGYDFKEVNILLDTVNPEIFIGKNYHAHFNEIKFMVDHDFKKEMVLAFNDYLNKK